MFQRVLRIEPRLRSARSNLWAAECVGEPGAEIAEPILPDKSSASIASREGSIGRESNLKVHTTF